ncbi:hypothetical protein Bca52824_095309, partial [Brassica carinata]
MCKYGLLKLSSKLHQKNFLTNKLKRSFGYKKRKFEDHFISFRWVLTILATQ